VLKYHDSAERRGTVYEKTGICFYRTRVNISLEKYTHLQRGHSEKSRESICTHLLHMCTPFLMRNLPGYHKNRVEGQKLT
jgi:hypothetical protein